MRSWEQICSPSESEWSVSGFRTIQANHLRLSKLISKYRSCARYKTIVHNCISEIERLTNKHSLRQVRFLCKHDVPFQYLFSCNAFFLLCPYDIPKDLLDAYIHISTIISIVLYPSSSSVSYTLLFKIEAHNKIGWIYMQFGSKHIHNFDDRKKINLLNFGNPVANTAFFCRPSYSMFMPVDDFLYCFFNKTYLMLSINLFRIKKDNRFVMIFVFIRSLVLLFTTVSSYLHSK